VESLNYKEPHQVITLHLVALPTQCVNNLD
jgi:hypothetical protein